MGITISLAGIPNRKDKRITPSRPIRRAKGSRKEAAMDKRERESTVRFAMHHKRAPAGTAAHRARPQGRKGSVQKGTQDDLQNLGPSVGRQLQHKGGGAFPLTGWRKAVLRPERS